MKLPEAAQSIVIELDPCPVVTVPLVGGMMVQVKVLTGSADV